MMSVARAARLSALNEAEIPVVKRGLILGSGLAGMQGVQQRRGETGGGAGAGRRGGAAEHPTARMIYGAERAARDLRLHRLCGAAERLQILPQLPEAHKSPDNRAPVVIPR